MVCLFCRHPHTHVINTRPTASDTGVWRRRSCHKCSGRFTTYEVVSSDELPLVVSDNDITARYSIPRLMVSILHELPPGEPQADNADALAHTITQRLLRARPHNLTPQIISQTTYDILYAYDSTAGARYGLSHGIISTIRK